ncbi:MAG: hypothetical protein JST85_21945 [Acidobacteria bacterium]|nr:hypothetical protein [Acidobacteriota bacterium]
MKFRRASSATEAEITEVELRNALNRTMRDSLKPIVISNGVVYLAASITTYLSQANSGGPAIFMAAMGIVLLGLYLALRQLLIPLDQVNLVTAILGALGLFTCVLLMHLYPEPRQTTNFMLLLFAAGAWMISTRWLLLLMFVVFLSWVGLAASAPPAEYWVHYGFSLFVAALMAVTIHFVRLRTLRNLETMRIHNQARKDMLEVALLTVRLREEEVRMLNEQLEQRVTERTAELKSSEDRNRTLFNELNHVARVATMGELSASIAHEVNQPLCAIINNAAYCHRWLENSAANLTDLSEIREAMNDISESGRRASEVIQRIRTLARKGEVEPVKVNVNEIIQQVVALMRSEALKRSVTLKTELQETLPYALGDRVQLQQVILNLILNGFDAMNDGDPAKRELCIRSRQIEDNTLLVEVSDTGMGINPSNSQKIFEAFYTTKPHGLGMGLSICQTIIRAHGGRLCVVDQLTAGATFQFTLPVFEEGQDD